MAEGVRLRRAAMAVLVAASFAAGWATAREPSPKVTPLLVTDRTIIGEAIAYPAGPARVTAAVVAMQPAEETGWHRHGLPLFAYILEGELTVDYGPNGKRTYKTGDSFMEAIDAAHNGRNTGGGLMRVLVVYMGAEGKTNAAPAPAPN